MGQQQLLLIVLGVIVVGIAVVVGINLFNANAETSTQDSIVSQGTNIGAMAQQYYKKPVSMGGGGNTFTGGPAIYPNGFQDFFNTLPANIRDSHDATWTVQADNDTAITLTAAPKDEAYTWSVLTTVTPTSIESVIQ